MDDFQPQAVKAVSNIGLDFENQALNKGYKLIAGVDEVGRGCLAGPVVAAACILDTTKPLPPKLNDSKKLPAGLRSKISEEIRDNCIAFSIGEVDAHEIDRINILEATKKAMCLAVSGLTPSADYLLIDALQLKQIPLPQKAIIRGDAISASIAAASIIAKTHRDELMLKIDEEFPQYGFARHVGYGTAAHFAALREHGPCRIHRISFRGVA